MVYACLLLVTFCSFHDLICASIVFRNNNNSICMSILLLSELSFAFLDLFKNSSVVVVCSVVGSFSVSIGCSLVSSLRVAAVFSH